jgi:hypothetical protein
MARVAAAHEHAAPPHAAPMRARSSTCAANRARDPGGGRSARLPRGGRSVVSRLEEGEGGGQIEDARTARPMVGPGDGERKRGGDSEPVQRRRSRERSGVFTGELARLVGGPRPRRWPLAVARTATLLVDAERPDGRTGRRAENIREVPAGPRRNRRGGPDFCTSHVETLDDRSFEI